MANNDTDPGDSIAGRRDRPNPFFQGRLTKQVLMGLPEGVLLQSNVANDPFTPVFEGILGSASTREELWRKLRDMLAAGIPAHGRELPLQPGVPAEEVEGPGQNGANLEVSFRQKKLTLTRERILP
jgi:hypothetical protein